MDQRASEPGGGAGGGDEMAPALAVLLAELSELAGKHKAEGDRLRRLPPALAEAFLRHDVYRLLLPRDLGGAELDPLDALRVVQALARVDGAIAWNLTIGIGSGLYAGYLPVTRSRPMFATPHCGIAGAYAPMGRGQAVAGGYRVSGRWSWASGVDQARLMVFGFIAQEPGAAQPTVKQALAPRDAFRVLDTWHVSGMRATGSTDYEVDDLFVPAEDTFQMFREPPRHPAAIFRMPAAFFGAAIAVVPLGIARSAIDGLVQLAAHKRGVPGRTALAEQTSAQYVVAKAEALVESSALYVERALAEIWRSAQRGEPIALLSRARARRACTHAAEASVEAVDLCCRAAGGHALFESQPFERALRDVRAATAHLMLGRGVLEQAGRVAFGLDPTLPAF